MDMKIKFNIKNSKLRCCLVGIILLTQIVALPHAYATSATSYTLTNDSKGGFVRTQDAYLPHRTITNLQLNKPDDIFIDKEDYLYIADTGNMRVIKYDTKSDKVLLNITNKEFKTPKGIFVTDAGEIYVADTKASCVFKFDRYGKLEKKYTRPESITFGSNDFNPMKVAVDKGGNVYVLGEGIYDGIIQLAYSGEFLGYFASNKVLLSFGEKLQDILFTKQQKMNLLGRTPVTFSNVFADSKGIIYTTTMGFRDVKRIKKHNTAGKNMIQNNIVATKDIVDIFVDRDGIIYGSSKEGVIFVYTNDGEFIHLFGSFNSDHDVSGLFTSLSSIAVDSEGKIWTADNEKSFIQSFVPTEYTNMIYKALDEFNKGRYRESIDIWNDILRLNQMSILAHNNIGKNFLFEEKYEKAMEHTKIAGNRLYYSQSYWEVRNIWLQRNISYILGLMLLLYIVIKTIKLMDKKKGILVRPRKVVNRIYDVPIIRDTLYMFKFFKHPIDSFYDIRVGNEGSLAGATVIYLGTFIIYIWSLVGQGFIYQVKAPEDIDLLSVVLGFFSITLLFILCNYLVSSIQDGDGSLEDVYKLLSYSMGPLIISLVLVTIGSHVLTLNEVFMLQFIRIIGIVWTGINILLGIQEIHSYDTRDAIKSIFITFGFMIIVVVVFLIVLIMSEQLYQFLEAIIKEGIRNVFAGKKI